MLPPCPPSGKTSRCRLGFAVIAHRLLLQKLLELHSGFLSAPVIPASSFGDLKAQSVVWVEGESVFNSVTVVSQL